MSKANFVIVGMKKKTDRLERELSEARTTIASMQASIDSYRERLRHYEHPSRPQFGILHVPSVPPAPEKGTV